jgi:hypothetical protein
MEAVAPNAVAFELRWFVAAIAFGFGTSLQWADTLKLPIEEPDRQARPGGRPDGRML